MAPQGLECIVSSTYLQLRGVPESSTPQPALAGYQLLSEPLLGIPKPQYINTLILFLQTVPYPLNFGHGMNGGLRRKKGVTISGGVRSRWRDGRNLTILVLPSLTPSCLGGGIIYEG